MDQAVFDASAPKKPVNVHVNSELLLQARALKINLSQALEFRLSELVAKGRRQAWKEQNREAIAEYNDRVTQDGVFGDKARVF